MLATPIKPYNRSSSPNVRKTTEVTSEPVGSGDEEDESKHQSSSDSELEDLLTRDFPHEDLPSLITRAMGKGVCVCVCVVCVCVVCGYSVWVYCVYVYCVYRDCPITNLKDSFRSSLKGLSNDVYINRLLSDPVCPLCVLSCTFLIPVCPLCVLSCTFLIPVCPLCVLSCTFLIPVCPLCVLPCTFLIPGVHYVSSHAPSLFLCVHYA